MSLLPDFVIIGAQKAGSTALMRRLSAHPQVYLPFGETRYFRDPWYQFQPASALESAVETDKAGVRARGIKCPDLLGTPGASDRVRASLPDARMIAILREPVSRAVSAYYWYVQFGLLPVEHPDVGLAKLLDGRATSPRAREILEFGRYGAYLPEFFDAYGRDRVLVLLADELRSDTEPTLRTALEFVGVDPALAGPDSGQEDNPSVYSLRRLKYLQLRTRYVLRAYPGWAGRNLQPAEPGWPWFADRAVAAFDRLVLARLVPNTPPALSPAIRRRLADYYRDDVAALEQLLGRSLAGWRADHYGGE